MDYNLPASKFKRGDLLVVKTFDGRNAHVWSLSQDSDVNVDVVDSLEDGDVCICITPSPYFKEYIIALTHNGMLGYIHEDSLKNVSELCGV